ncbi:MAG TPA: SGNH/GDSL hydrolase family protein [Vicinamibacterales bacterium]
MIEDKLESARRRDRCAARGHASWLSRLFMHALIVCAIAAFTACSNNDEDGDGSPTEPTPPTQGQEVRYAAIGASDALGVGGSVPCLPFTDCPSGTGYVQTVTRRLRDAGRTVTLLNLGIPGAVLGPDIENLARELGRGTIGNFLERELPFVPRNSTLVTIFAGGNDVNIVGSAIEAGRGGSDPIAYAQGFVQGFGRDLSTLVNGVRSRAPNARIVVLNLPNLAALPYVANRPLDQRRIFQTLAVSFSAQVNTLASQGVMVLDLMCDPRSYSPSNYSSDGFHPNDAGYAYLSELVYNAVTTGSAPPPRAQCAEMAIF